MRPLQIFSKTPNINFMAGKWAGLVVSVVLVLASLTLVAVKGLNFGIDFTGGILVEAKFESEPDMAGLRKLLNEQHEGDISLQRFGSNDNLLVRIGTKTESQAERQVLINGVKKVLNEFADGKVEFRKEEYVGPKVGSELIKAGVTALLLSFVGIMIYIWFRFEWQYGVGGILSLVHDTILTFGFFAITQIEFNLTSVAAILTIVGYSINDSVVIYDRIRENLRKFKKLSLVELLNLSLNETLSRTILTSSTVLLTLLSLVLLGGAALQSLSLPTFFGIFVGTYSSIYVSATILVFLDLRNERKAEAKA